MNDAMKRLGFLLIFTLGALVLTPPSVCRAAEDWFNKGNAHFDAHEYVEAVHAYTKALEETPQLAEAYLNRGLTYNNLDQPQKAIADFTRAIALRPNFIEAYFYRGLANYNMDRPDKAIEDLTKVLDLNPKYAEAWYGLGITLEARGDLAGANAAYESALRERPG